MSEGGISLENMQRVDAQINREYEVRYANAAIQELSQRSVEEIRASVKELEERFGDRKDILSTLQSIALFTRTAIDPETVLSGLGVILRNLLKMNQRINMMERGTT